MPIRYVSKERFDTFGPPRVDDTITEEVEWFADDDGVVIGVITCDKSTPNYSIAVLGRDQHGTLRALDSDTEFTAVDAARRQLFARMETALATGVTVFPQGRHMGTPADGPELGGLVPSCPVCDGPLTQVPDRASVQTVWVCVDCGTSLLVPTSAWDVAKRKGDAKYPSR